MAVILKPKFTKADIRKLMQERMQIIDSMVVARLQKVGETFVKNARSVNTYTDQTGNLRNSIGYILLRDGIQLSSNFRRSAHVNVTAKNGKERISKGSKDGVNAGRDLAQEVAAKYPKGYVLIVVAGMEYAAAVESKKKDVLTGSSHQAVADLKEAIATIRNKIGRVR